MNDNVSEPRSGRPLHDPRKQSDLVAFLDGELSEGETGNVARLMADDETVQREVEGLERSWALLDLLPPPTQSQELAGQTLLRIRADLLQREVQRRRYTAAVQSGVRLAGWLAGLTAVSLLGFLVAWHVWPDSSKKLLADLPLIENLATYQDAGDIEFMRTIAESDLPFDAAADDGGL
jgi:hypothetical protein